ncbi:MAG: hypothetical protein ACXABU_05615 [Candidatus Hodarchaeales archaeon]|jgi:hypothetical protein
MKNVLLGLLKLRTIVILTLILSSLIVTINSQSKSSFKGYTNHKKSLTPLVLETNFHEELPRQRSILKPISTEENLFPFIAEQNASVHLTSKEIYSINSSRTSKILIESTPQSSSFIIHSGASEERSSWINNIEPDYGEVEVFQNLTDFSPYYRLNFSENNITPVSGITNIDFNVTTNPSPVNYSTEFSFEYRIPYIDGTLKDEVHSLVLELRFNSASLNFIITDNGSFFGDPLEENVYKPGTKSLYVLCNETEQSDWISNSFNITHLITQYFLPSEYSMFSQLKTVFCYMFAFIPEFDICLDIRGLNYTSSLPPNESAITYTIGELVVQSENGSLTHESINDNISISMEENTSWKIYQQTKFFVVITRNFEFLSSPHLINWNKTFVHVNYNLSIPQFFPNPLSSLLFAIIPSDWTFLENINFSISFEELEIYEILHGNITGQLYQFSTQNLKSLLFQFNVPNYIENLEAPTILSYYEMVQFAGNLIQPSTGILHLYLMNETIFGHLTTVCMLNGSFIFPMISIEDHYPLGVVNLVVNLSSVYHFGVYQQLVHIHSGGETTARISLLTPDAIEIYQYDPIFLNLSLEKEGQKYIEESTMVIIVVGESIHQLHQSINGFYHLTLDHVVWPPQQRNITIIASNKGDFFASKLLNLTVYPVVVDWDIQGIPQILHPYNNLSFRINMFISPQEGGTNWPVSGADLTIWINSTVIQQSQTNNFGYKDVIISTSNYESSNILNLILIAKLENIILKMNTFTITISNDSIETDRYHPILNEITRAPVISNKSFFHIFNITYPINGSLWYISSDNYLGTPIFAYLLRNDFILEIEVTDQFLIWDLMSDSTNNDTLLLEFQGPLVIFSVSEEISSYEVHIKCVSNFSISNYTLILDLDFIEFPLDKIYLRDFLKRDITNKFEIELLGSQIKLKQLSIINGILVNYYLEIQFSTPKIEILTEFKENYTYDEQITGRWRFTSSSKFSFSVLYTISDQYSSECRNTTIIPFSNNTFIVEAFFQKFKWNISINVKMELNFSNGALSLSPEQTFSIVDPYPPNYSYYLESFEKVINLHIITSEPDLGSGIRNISCLYFGIKYNSSILNSNHYLIEIPIGYSQFGEIYVIISDWAANEISFSIDLKNELESPNMGDKMSPAIFLPSLISIMAICGIFAFKFIRKRRTSIL